MIKFILDTDIGDDIDDSFALALACLAPGTELLAVTTVFRNTHCRTGQARQLLDSLGRQVPVYTGLGMPLSGKIPPLPGDGGADPLAHPPCQYDDSMACEPSEKDAVTALLELTAQYPGEVVLVPIGPLTNIAAAIQRDPAFVKNVKKIVTMGGWFTNPVAEWNILCDPVAADIVYASGIPVEAIGLDVTLQCPLDDHLLEDFRQAGLPYTDLITRWLDRWYDCFHFEKSVLHDPLAMCSVFARPCGFVTRYCRVLLDPEHWGVIECSDTPRDGFHPIQTADAVDREEFYRIFRRHLLPGISPSN